jgi:signal transduction histidine kinase
LPKPAVVIEQTSINGRAMNPADSLVSPPGNRLFAVNFAALTFAGTARYRYKLEGLDREWIDSGGRTEAIYHGVPPGEYTFRVAAAHEAGEWNEQTASAGLRVSPFFHQTAWFYALSGCLMLALVYAAHRIRTAALHREFEAVLAERTRIAREIHDTLLQGFAGAALQLGAIAKRWRRDPDLAQQKLDGVLAQIDECLAEARREIGELRGSPLSTPPFADRLRAVASGACAGSGADSQVEVPGDAPGLPAEVEKSLLRIASESVRNAARHARATVIQVRVEFSDGQVRLVTQDNGRGMTEPDIAGAHFGVAGMKERAELLGGRFSLRSQPGRGTEVEVTLPLRGTA